MQPKGDPQTDKELDGTRKRKSVLTRGKKILSKELCLRKVYEEKQMQAVKMSNISYNETESFGIFSYFAKVVLSQYPVAPLNKCRPFQAFGCPLA